MNTRLHPLRAVLFASLASACAADAPPPPTVSGLTGSQDDAVGLSSHAEDRMGLLGVPGDLTAGRLTGSPGRVVDDDPEVSATNVVYISIDTLRRDRISTFGGGDTTPWLDSFLDEALVMDSHRSCSNWTFASMSCAFTGAYNTDQGFMPVMHEANVLPPSSVTMAEQLRDAGYATALVSTTQLSQPEHELFRGYDSVQLRLDQPTLSLVGDVTVQADLLLDQDKPWLLHVHSTDPHFPYEAPASYLASALPPVAFDLTDHSGLLALEAAWPTLSDKDQDNAIEALSLLYDAEVRFLDAGLQAVLQVLEDRGMLDDAVVVVMSDHGEQLFERGFSEHGTSLHVEESAALAAFKAPGLAPGVITAATSHVDLMPTLFNLLGLPHHDQVTGEDVRDVSSLRPVFAAYASLVWGVGQSVEIGGDRLLMDWDDMLGHVFELDLDPEELQDVAGTDRERTQRLLDALGPQQAALALLVEGIVD